LSYVSDVAFNNRPQIIFQVRCSVVFLQCFVRKRLIAEEFPLAHLPVLSIWEGLLVCMCASQISGALKQSVMSMQQYQQRGAEQRAERDSLAAEPLQLVYISHLPTHPPYTKRPTGGAAAHYVLCVC
jgi:hypothetical protein